MTETKYAILKSGCIETVTLTKGMLNDPRLSWKAKALFAYLKTFDEGHDFTVETAMQVGKDGRDSIRSGLGELQKYGYLRRKVFRNGGGQIIKHAIELQEACQIEENPQTNAPQEGQKSKISSKTHHITGNPVSGRYIDNINKEELNIISKGVTGGKKKPRPYLHPDALTALTDGWESHMGKGTFPKKKVRELSGIRDRMVIDGPAEVKKRMIKYMEEEKRNDNYRYVSMARFAQRYHLLASKAQSKSTLGPGIEEAMS